MQNTRRTKSDPNTVTATTTKIVNHKPDSVQKQTFISIFVDKKIYFT